VTFYSNYGDPYPRGWVIETRVVIGTIGALPEVYPKRDGHYFLGWNRSPDGTGPFVYYGGYLVTESFNLYAHWGTVPPGYHMVTFYRNNLDTGYGAGYPYPSEMVVEDGTSIGIGNMPTPPTRLRYTFAGWNTQEDGSGTLFDHTTNVTGNITVYAQWDLNPVGMEFIFVEGGLHDGKMRGRKRQSFP
jgi:uncharacterized repeat protein (TIGR02543 family)